MLCVMKLFVGLMKTQLLHDFVYESVVVLMHGFVILRYNAWGLIPIVGWCN